MSKKGRKIVRVVGFTILGLVLFALLLPLVAVGLLSIPSVRSFALDKAQETLYEKTGIKASVGGFSFRWSDCSLAFRDVAALDVNRDTLLCVQDLSLRVNVPALRDSTLDIRSLQLRGVVIDSKQLFLPPAMALKGRLDSLILKGAVTDLLPAAEGLCLGSTVESLSVGGLDLGIRMPSDSAAVSEEEDTTSSSLRWTIDLHKGSLRDISVGLQTMDLDVKLQDCSLSARADLSGAGYSARPLAVRGLGVRSGDFSIVLDTLGIVADMDSTLISVRDLTARSSSPPLSLCGFAGMDLHTMLINADLAAALKEFSLRLKGNCCLEDSSYDAQLDLDGPLDLDSFNLPVKLFAKGRLDASGRGFNPLSEGAALSLDARLDSCSYDAAKLGKTCLQASLSEGLLRGCLDVDAAYDADGMNAAAAGKIQFRASALASSRPSGTLDALLTRLDFDSDSLSLHSSDVHLHSLTGRDSSAVVLKTDGVDASVSVPLYATDILPSLERITKELTRLQDSLGLDAARLRRSLPPLKADITLTDSNPLMDYVRGLGYSFSSVSLSADLSPQKGADLTLNGRDLCMDTLSLRSAGLSIKQLSPDRMDCTASLSFPGQHQLPGVEAALEGSLEGSLARARLRAGTAVRDGNFGLEGVAADVDVDVSATMEGDRLHADGKVELDSLRYDGHDFGAKTLALLFDGDTNGACDAKVSTDSIPLSLASFFVPVDNLSLGGSASVRATLAGTLDSLALGGELTTQSVTVDYAPYDVHLSLEDAPIRLADGKVLIDSLHIFAAEGTVASLDGNVALDNMYVDLSLDSDRFKPSRLQQMDSLSATGNLAVAMHAHLWGVTDSLKADGSLTVLDETDVQYNIDKKNYVKVKAEGKLDFDYALDGDLLLNGRLDVPSGKILYSPSIYPLQPFDIKEGSCITFNGPLSAMDLNITAQQKTKATVGGMGDVKKQVDFLVGVQVKNNLDNLGLDFTLSAPDNTEVQKEINSFSKEERDRVAAALLATGMYVSETNTALSESGYALSSIMQHSLNALANNKLGKFVEVDVGMDRSSNDEGGTVSDYKMALSKTLFDDRLKLTVGGRYSSTSSGEGSAKSGQIGLDNISAQWQIKKGSPTNLILFHKWDYQNIMEGELTKDGLGVQTEFEWGQKDPLRLDLQGNVSYRSNNQLGPDLSATLSKTNLLHRGESLSTDFTGAYYWGLGERTPHQSVNTDTFQLGVETSLSFPEIIFPGAGRKASNLLSSSTAFSLGYMFSNYPGTLHRDKFSASVGYTFQPSKSVTHIFNPLQLSIVNSEMGDGFWESTTWEFMYKEILAMEFVPSMEYRFLFNNSHEPQRKVTTRLEASVKESANLISGIGSLFGWNFNEQGKTIFGRAYDQFVTLKTDIRHRIALGEKSALATRVLLGASIGFGNSDVCPMSESFYVGGPNSIRAFKARSIGPGAYYSELYDSYMDHAGEIKAEFNLEYRFPLVWMLEGAVFLDAGNVWSMHNTATGLSDEERALFEQAGWPICNDGLMASTFLDTIALGSGLGLRFVYQSIVIRLDAGIALHAPYDTGMYTYYNIPRFWDGVRLNFGVGYPF